MPDSVPVPVLKQGANRLRQFIPPFRYLARNRRFALKRSRGRTILMTDGLAAALAVNQHPPGPRFATAPQSEPYMHMIALRALMSTSYAPVGRATITLGEESTPAPSDLGRVDCVSGGAIVQATLHALRRVPSLSAAVGVIEPDLFDQTNLNRYALGRRSQVDELKTELLEGLSTPMFTISGEAVRFDEQSAPELAPLTPRVIVGTDNVPARWAVQTEKPQWLVVGATSEFMAMASEHDGSAGCAACAHPFDDGIRAKIPTVSFLSYWAGLMVAARVLHHAAGVVSTESREVSLIASLRPDSPFGAIRYANARSPRCPCTVRALGRRNPRALRPHRPRVSPRYCARAPPFD